MPIKQIRMVAVASLAALGSLAGPVSIVSAHTWDHRTSYLRVPPPSNFVQCAPGRRIHLTGGRYRWHAFIHHTGHRAINRDTWTTVQRIGGGWYRWNDCLRPVERNGRF